MTRQWRNSTRRLLVTEVVAFRELMCDYEYMNTHSNNRASKRQLDLIATLIAKHEVSEGFVKSLRDEYYRGRLTQEAASVTLSLLDTLPLREVAEANIERPIILQKDGAVARISPTRDGGYRTSVLVHDPNSVAKFVDRFVSVDTLKSYSKLSKAQARSLARQTGLCGGCGTILKSAKTREAGFDAACSTLYSKEV